MSLEIACEDFTEADHARFAERLRQSLDALAALLAQRDFGTGKATLGAELELTLVDPSGRPLPVNRSGPVARSGRSAAIRGTAVPRVAMARVSLGVRPTYGVMASVVLVLSPRCVVHRDCQYVKMEVSVAPVWSQLVTAWPDVVATRPLPDP